MTLIFPTMYYVIILHLSCNVKKAKTITKWSHRKAMSWSVTVYNKQLSSQCYVTAVK
jgi:hypothetical protein